MLTLEPRDDHHRLRSDQRPDGHDPCAGAAAALNPRIPRNWPRTMIGLPLYRLLIAAGLVLSSAAATTRLGYAEPNASWATDSKSMPLPALSTLSDNGALTNR